MTWTSPDPWHCYECGAAGIGGRPAHDDHNRTVHPPRATQPKVPGPVVPEGICSSDVRAWALKHGWPKLGKRGRLPQSAIDAYLKAGKPRPTVDLEVVDDLRALGNTREQIAYRLGVTTGAIEKAESRRRQS